MELILKLRSSCNFNCTFCSASDIRVNNYNYIPQQIKDLLKLLKVNGLIITGGEPLMVSPEYLEELVELAGEQCENISLTSNLKDFYLYPDKWTNFLTQPKVGVCTSFHYGNNRMWDKNTIYDEKMFLDVIKLFLNISNGKSIRRFIATIDENNERYVLDHIYLAQKLNCKTKLNPIICSGLSKNSYPMYKMFQHYLSIIKLKLDQYEVYCSEREFGNCPFNTNLLCNSCCRCAYIDSIGKLHYGLCDYLIATGNEFPVEEKIPEVKPIIPEKETLINDRCIYCELFALCNGCNYYRDKTKLFPEHCEEMLKMKDQLIDVGWKI
jgi:organic radical activating enzyme